MVNNETATTGGFYLGVGMDDQQFYFNVHKDDTVILWGVTRGEALDAIEGHYQAIGYQKTYVNIWQRFADNGEVVSTISIKPAGK
jgi:hypothetical protein